MTNTEKKQQIFADIVKKHSHLSAYCTIECKGLDDDSDYFHPRFILDETTFITSQCDVKSSNIYATRLNYKVGDITEVVEIYDGLLDSIVFGWYTNKERVFLACSTLKKVKDHINNLNNYANDYIIQMLMGSSLNELTTAFINEFKVTQNLIDYIDSKK